MPVKYLVFNIAVMEELTLTTPSILFSAISLIMLAYTNRFLAYAQVIRNLKGEHENRPSAMTKLQLDNLRKRLYMARSMQIYGVISLLLCVVCTFFIYIGLQTLAIYTFGVALLLLVISLGISAVPPLFKLIQEQSGTPWDEMYKVFNMGHRMEIYVDEEIADDIITISKSFNIDAQIVGRCYDNDEGKGNKLTIISGLGKFIY